MNDLPMALDALVLPTLTLLLALPVGVYVVLLFRPEKGYQ